jgi:hypothetical protein
LQGIDKQWICVAEAGMFTVTVGDLEIDLTLATGGRVLFVVRGRFFGLETVATDEEVMNLARRLTAVVEEREGESN